MPSIFMRQRISILLIWIFVLILIGFTRLISHTMSIPVWRLVQDPTTTMEAPFYTGIISNIGILLWTATASICFFTSLALARFVNKAWKPFLFVSGLITSLLLFDDLFLVHDEIFPVYLGVKGEVVGGSYLVLVGGYLLRFRTLIQQSNYALLVMALGAFAVSAGVDIVHPFDSMPMEEMLFEDGAKIMGISSWLAYFAHLSACVVGVDNDALSQGSSSYSG